VFPLRHERKDHSATSAPFISYSTYYYLLTDGQIHPD
jgi:hypothetical protein